MGLASETTLHLCYDEIVILNFIDFMPLKSIASLTIALLQTSGQQGDSLAHLQQNIVGSGAMYDMGSKSDLV